MTVAALNFAITFFYKQQSQFYEIGKTESDDLTESESDFIYRQAWLFSLDAFALLLAGVIGLFFAERPLVLFQATKSD